MREDAFENLIAWCPLLERLTLMNFEGFSHLKLKAPNLQFFDIGGDFEDVTFVDTKVLSIVSIGLYISVESDFSARQKGTSNLLKFFSCLHHIQRLEVQSYFLKYLALGNVPARLPVKYLELNYLSMRINFNDTKENKAACCLFRSSPNLTELEMLALPDDESNARLGSKFWEENNHIESVFQNLRVVRLADIAGIRPELDFMKFLLANAPVLEKLTIKPASVDGEFGLLKELLRYRRASVQAEVIYLDA
ncbi:hypothetical protein RDABS01_010648 [Bienertia sinuspersici]